MRAYGELFVTVNSQTKVKELYSLHTHSANKHKGITNKEQYQSNT